ncbi:MAG: hypothetical protein R3C53_11465 [Pirellulaceae bacterium]
MAPFKAIIVLWDKSLARLRRKHALTIYSFNPGCMVGLVDNRYRLSAKANDEAKRLLPRNRKHRCWWTDRTGQVPVANRSTAYPLGSRSERQWFQPSNRPTAEGLPVRRAVRALDNGDRATVNEIRDELAKSEQYRQLARAIEGLIAVKQNRFDEAISIAKGISAVPVLCKLKLT